MIAAITKILYHSIRNLEECIQLLTGLLNDAMVCTLVHNLLVLQRCPKANQNDLNIIKTYILFNGILLGKEFS
jgi:hypothetical protein